MTFVSAAACLIIMANVLVMAEGMVDCKRTRNRMGFYNYATGLCGSEAYGSNKKFLPEKQRLKPEGIQIAGDQPEVGFVVDCRGNSPNILECSTKDKDGAIVNVDIRAALEEWSDLFELNGTPVDPNKRMCKLRCGARSCPDIKCNNEAKPTEAKP